MINHDNKLIFIHIARTGGTSIETALSGKDWWLIDPQTKHISAGMARKIYGEEVWRTYTKFSVVRNPWDRVVSMWATQWWHEASGLDENCSFEEFIRNIKPHPHEICGHLSTGHRHPPVPLRLAGYTQIVRGLHVRLREN